MVVVFVGCCFSVKDVVARGEVDGNWTAEAEARVIVVVVVPRMEMGGEAMRTRTAVGEDGVRRWASMAAVDTRVVAVAERRRGGEVRCGVRVWR